MSQSLQPNRAIALGDKGVGKSPTPPKLSKLGVIQFGQHKGDTLSQIPLNYLKWLRRDNVLEKAEARQALDKELRRRKQSPQAKTLKELVSAMGFVTSGKHENQNIKKLSKAQLRELLKTPNISERSKQRIKTLLAKKQNRKRRKDRSRK